MMRRLLDPIATLKLTQKKTATILSCSGNIAVWNYHCVADGNVVTSIEPAATSPDNQPGLYQLKRNLKNGVK